jgi:hypothetical protein
MAILGPNGQAVMLMSDACTTAPAQDEDRTFDDSAPTFLSSSSCPNAQDSGFRPSNYGDPADDDLTQGGGAAGPYLNALSFLAGGSPNGTWSLFLLDDNPVAIGFTINAWALTLEVQPPAAAPTAPQDTGQRTAALAKCKGKKSKKARRKCRQKAQSLPL